MWLFNGKNIKEPEPCSVRIGKQVWMTENLNVNHYRNGVFNSRTLRASTMGKYQIGTCYYYYSDPENGKKYGKLYNWYAVNDERVSLPNGWHIPTKVWNIKLYPQQ